MNKGIILIQSYCDTDEKLNILKTAIGEYKGLGLDVLVTSPLNIDSCWYEDADWFIYDKENPLIWKYKRFIHWRIVNNLKFERIIPDYGWAAYHQIKTGFNFIKDKDYNQVFIANYDLVIDESIKSIINNKIEGYTAHHKGDDVYNPGLVFLSLTKENANKLISSFSINEYVSDTVNFAEIYLKKKISEIPSLKNIGNAHDYIDSVIGDRVWNHSPSQDFEVFVDSETMLRIYCKTLNNHRSQSLVINDTIQALNEGENFINHPIEKDSITRFGVFVDDSYYNLIHLINLNMEINRIKLKELGEW